MVAAVRHDRHRLRLSGGATRIATTEMPKEHHLLITRVSPVADPDGMPWQRVRQANHLVKPVVIRVSIVKAANTMRVVIRRADRMIVRNEEKGCK